MKIIGKAFGVAIFATASTATGQAQGPAVRLPEPRPPAAVTAFLDVNVIPMDADRVLLNQTVVIENGRITALGPAVKVDVPVGALRINGRGKYLMPGLADMHVHLHTAFYDVEGRYDFSAVHDTVLANHWLFLFLANGVTTVRNMDYLPDGGRALQLRRQAEAGNLLSPRIYTSGSWAGRDLNRNNIAPESVATRVMAYQAAGYDFLKVRDESKWEFDSVAAVAKRIGMPIAGHVIRGRSAEQALTSGAYASIEHLDGYHSLRPPAPGWDIPIRRLQNIPALVEVTGHSVVRNVPHMTLFEVRAGEVNPLEWPEMRYLTARQYRKVASRMARMNASQIQDSTNWVLTVRRQIVKQLQDAGAKLLLGSDTPIAPLVPGFAVHHELEALVRAGLTPYEALAMATRNVGAFFAAQHVPILSETGTVAIGNRADLVLLDGNPLQDVGAVARPAGVMSDGRWLPRATIDRRLAVLPYWKFPAPEVEELALLRAGLVLTEAQEEAVEALIAVHRIQWKGLVDSLRSGDHDTAAAFDSVGGKRLLQLAAQQFGEYRAIALTPRQRRVFDRKARAWMERYQEYGYQVVIPGIPAFP